jgi:hypothetical protein
MRVSRIRSENQSLYVPILLHVNGPVVVIFHGGIVVSVVAASVVARVVHVRIFILGWRRLPRGCSTIVGAVLRCFLWECAGWLCLYWLWGGLRRRSGCRCRRGGLGWRFIVVAARC